MPAMSTEGLDDEGLDVAAYTGSELKSSRGASVPPVAQQDVVPASAATVASVPPPPDCLHPGWALQNIQKLPTMKPKDKRSQYNGNRDTRGKLPVRVHVYDLLDEECEAEMGITTLNFGKAMTLLNDNTLNNMNFGFFHAGVELDDLEYSFGFIEEGTGLFICHPKKSIGYTYRTTIDMGGSYLTSAQIEDVMWTMRREWSGASYRLIGRNCCNFCNELCIALGVGAPPTWINALAESLVPVTSASQAVSESAQATLDWASNYKPPPISGVLDENFQCSASLSDENHRCWPSTPSIPPPKLAIEDIDYASSESECSPKSNGDSNQEKKSKQGSWLSFFFCGDDAPYSYAETHSLVGEIMPD